MRRRRGIKWSTLLLCCLLFVSLQVLGVSYARWTGVLQIGQTALSGALDVQTSDEHVRAFLVDSTGKQVDASPSVTAQLAEDGETLRLTMEEGFAATALTGDGLLKLEVSIQPGEEATLDGVEEILADLSAQTGEMLDITPADPELVVGNTVFFAEDLPEGTLDGFAVPLTAEIYRQVEMGQKGPIAAVYLRLTEESREALAALEERTLSLDAASLPQQLLTAAGAEETKDALLSVSAEIRVCYACDITLYVEQGNEDILPLTGEEGQS